MGQSVYNLWRPLCDFSLGPNGCEYQTRQKPQQAGSHVTGRCGGLVVIIAVKVGDMRSLEQAGLHH